MDVTPRSGRTRWLLGPALLTAALACACFVGALPEARAQEPDAVEAEQPAEVAATEIEEEPAPPPEPPVRAEPPRPAIPQPPAQPRPQPAQVRPRSAAPQLGAPGPGAGGDATGFTTTEGGLPVHEARPKIGDNEDGIAFDFQEQELNRVIEALGPYIGGIFDIDPNIGRALVTVISHDKVPPEMAFDVLQAILTIRGYTMVRSLDGNWIRVVPVTEQRDKRPLYIGPDMEVPGFDTFRTHVVPVRHANAEELVDLLRNLGSQYADVSVYTRTNTLILSDTADGIRRMLRVLEEFDVPGYDTVMDIFYLEFARAEIIATQLQDVLIGSDGQVRAVQQPRAPTPAPARPVRAQVPGQQQPIVAGGAEPVLRMVSDERINALIVVASEALMEEVRRLIDRLDIPLPPESNNIHVYPLLHADPEEIEAVITALAGAAPQQAGQQGGAGAAQSGEIQLFEKKITVARFDATKSLVIMASPQDYRILAETISQLDVPRRQVNVEAMIMEVVINDNYELAVESAALAESDFFALNNVVTLANILATGPISALSGAAGLTGGILDGTTDIVVPDPTTGQLVRQTIPNVPLLLTALSALTSFEVLSKPNLTTVDNVEQEASIVVGQEVPFITGTSTGLDQPAVGRSIFSQIQRQEVGIKMFVTPRISAGDTVSMKLSVEVSDTVQSPIGQDPNVVGPTLQLSKIENEVVVRDGDIGIMGGLISEGTDRSVRQPPILGDLPLVGALFRRKSNERSKRNLVVLVVPHIIRDRQDFDRITDFRVEDFRSSNIDVLFEKGFIKKIQSSHYMRNKHRPTEAQLERLQRGGFDRGTVRR